VDRAGSGALSEPRAVRAKAPEWQADLGVVVALMGARMHYAIPRLLHDHSVLAHFYTDICASKGALRILPHVPRLLLPQSAQRLAARVVPGVPPRLITAFTRFGLEYQRRRALARSPEVMTGVHIWAGEHFCRLIQSDQYSRAGGLYCFNSAGLELLKEWRRSGRRTILEQTSAPRRVEARIMTDEEQAFPGWQPPALRGESVDAYIAREEAEWREADVIVCGSDFARAGIEECGGPAERCVVVPYGIPKSNFRPSAKMPLAGRPLRVLTVGQVGLQKGSHYVMDAARRLAGRTEFRMVGSMALLPERAAELTRHVQYGGIIARNAISAQFDWADVFLFPSLCEGSATVTYEALSAGLPVVTTRSSGSIVENGISGIIVPERDSTAIVDALENFLCAPDVLVRMGMAASDRSVQGSLEAYGQRLMTVIGCS
jgi:hypothetical protein